MAVTYTRWSLCLTESYPVGLERVGPRWRGRRKAGEGARRGAPQLPHLLVRDGREAGQVVGVLYRLYVGLGREEDEGREGCCAARCGVLIVLPLGGGERSNFRARSESYQLKTILI